MAQQVRNALNISATDQLALDTYRAATEQAFASLAALDGNMSYALIGNLTDAWFAQRAVFLQQIDVNADNEILLEVARNQQMNISLQNALSFNSSLATTLPYETARKTVGDLLIRHLLQQPMTQALYQQAFALAQQSVTIIGQAGRDAINFLATCDQGQFSEPDGVQARSSQKTSGTIANTAALQLSPNPSTGFVMVQLPIGSNGVLAIYNSSGQKVRSVVVEPDINSLTLDLAQVPAGLYRVVLFNLAQQAVSSATLSIAH